MTAASAGSGPRFVADGHLPVRAGLDVPGDVGADVVARRQEGGDDQRRPLSLPSSSVGDGPSTSTKATRWPDAVGDQIGQPRNGIHAMR